MYWLNTIYQWKEQTTDIYYNRDTPQNHYAKWEMPEVEKHILHHFIFMKWTEKANLYIEGKQIGGCLHRDGDKD